MSINPIYAVSQLAKLGSKIPPNFNSPILTSSVQITCVIGIYISYQTQRSLEGCLTHLKRRDYANSQYKVLKLTQQFFDHSRIVRIVARCLFRYHLVPNLLTFPLLIALAINKPYLSPHYFCAAKGIGLISVALTILSQELLHGDDWP